MKKTLLLLLFIVITSCYQETSIVVDGDFTTSYVNEDESIPVIIKIDNKITGADTYEWTFEDGSPSTSSLKNHGEILYDEQGTAMNIVRVLVGNGYTLGSQYLGNR